MPYTLNELLAKVRAIDIASHKRSNRVLRGDYRSAFKGTGMQFKEVRNYNYGDDVRNIDWNVSARMLTPHVKVFEEEREQSMLLLLDVSSSNVIGNGTINKLDLIAEVAATLALSALANKEKVGAIIFADKILYNISPKHGRDNVLYILRSLISAAEKKYNNTDIKSALQLVLNTQRRQAEVFLISDFLANDYSATLKAAAYKHHIVGLHIYDVIEKQINNIGLIAVQDVESGHTQWIDSSSASLRKNYELQFVKHIENTSALFKNNNAKWLSLNTQQDYIKELHQFFKQ